MEYLKMPKEELANLFVENLLETNRGFNFYVNWDNVEAYKPFKIELNAMNSLIKCSDFDITFKELLQKIPTVVATFPLLFALAKVDREKVWNGRNQKLTVVNSHVGEENNLEFDFNIRVLQQGLSNEQIDLYLSFFDRMGLKNLFLNLAESSIVDYVIGVLVGLDSNGRKNRGGSAFELACHPMIENICEKHGIVVLFQETFKELEKYGVSVSEDIQNRKADFILLKGSKCINIEVNYFNGGGSKPEEIIDSYINRQSDLEKHNIDFVMITDGKGCWGNNTKSQLLKGFRTLSYLMNFNLAKQGMLEEVLINILSK